MGFHVVQRLRYAQLLNIVCVIIVYAVTFCLLLPVILRDWPYSPYYNGTWNDVDVVRRVVSVCLSFLMYKFFSTVWTEQDRSEKVENLAPIFDPSCLWCIVVQKYECVCKLKCAVKAQMVTLCILQIWYSLVHPTARTHNCDTEKFNPLKCIAHAICLIQGGPIKTAHFLKSV